MKLRSLRLHGFKSFADSTDIAFHQGITAVVGPNGCGKSNIGDAIRWVLGEQRPTAIRGAKMEEAIFQGTVNRRPVNRGSVVMVVSNEDKLMPVPFEEVEIGRTVYRDGGSEYSINRSTCRLRDVLDLCRDTGLGANAYAVIENRMIDAILSDRAEERRALFEEAAGIGKYKDRRKAATRRLELADLDLQRLDDLIGEVESKVRSLARQKGKAQRYHSLRERRLSVEVAVVRNQLESLRSRLQQVENELAGGRELGEGMIAELQAAETEYETLRLRQADAERERTQSAQKAEEIRTELVRWERDLAVADEKAVYAERRLAQIQGERHESQERARGTEEEIDTLRSSEAKACEELGGMEKELEGSRRIAGEVQARVEEAREELAVLESQERGIALRGAQLEGDAEAAEAQAAELDRRLDRLSREIDSTSEALTDIRSQGDLFSDRLTGLQREVVESRDRVRAAQEAVEKARASLEEVRVKELEAADRAFSLGAQLAALQEMAHRQEGVEPVVQAVLEYGLDGVEGTLVDFLRAAPDWISAVEIFLGPLAQGLVVRDSDSAASLSRWFEDEWEGGGGLIVLPLDRVGAAEADAILSGEVKAEGAGAPWVRRLLEGVKLVDDGEVLVDQDTSGVRLGPSGLSIDSAGVVRIGIPGGSSGILERRERIQSLTAEEEAARRAFDTARSQREGSQEEVAEADSVLSQLREALQSAEDAQRETDAQVTAQVDRHTLVDRQREELARQLEGTKAARSRAIDRARSSREDRDIILTEQEELGDRRQEVKEVLERVSEEWERARAEEARLAVQEARIKGDLSRVQERLEDVQRSREAALERLGVLDEEEVGLRGDLEEVKALRLEGESSTETLFRERDDAEAELRARSERLALVGEDLLEVEGLVRQARAVEREATDQRHRKELEREELAGRIGRIQDRLEGEWGRPLETLLEEAESVEGDPEELREELREIVEKLERIGLVNMLAVEEHEEESTRLNFLREQRADLEGARDDLRKAIKQINETATQLFDETFQAIRSNFQSTFQRLFEGGEADLWLEDPDDPLEAPIEIHASPRGKKTRRIDLLSGGERALTALSLLFGIYLVKPSPFCVLDEVDAPLDESNIGRFIRLLQEFKEQTQFVVITHNPRTIEAADWIYGVTMEEPGVSSVVGVRLEDALEAGGSAV